MVNEIMLRAGDDVKYGVYKINNVNGDTQVKRRWNCGFNKDYAIDLCRKLRNEEGDGIDHYVVVYLNSDGVFLGYMGKTQIIRRV